jgi:hypothetical protein
MRWKTLPTVSLFVALALFPPGAIYSIKELFNVESSTDNIQKYDTKFIFRPYLEVNTLVFQIREQNDKVAPITFLPNISLVNPGIAFSYEWLGGSFVYNVPGTSLDRDQYGKTSYFDLQFNWNFRHFGGDLIYQDYKGFYITDPGTAGETSRIRPDMTMQILGANAYFVFNRKFSTAAAFHQSERQIETAGSVLLMLATKYYRIANSTEIIPQQMRAPFGEAGTLSSGRFVDVTVGPGYGHMSKLGDWALTAVLMGGLGVQNQRYNTTTDNRSRYNLAINGILKWSAVYHYDTSFAGAQFAVNGSVASFGQGQFWLFSASVQFFVGWRF